MKKLRKLSLQQLDKVELGKRQEGLLLGGGTPGSCRCGSCSSTGTPSSTAKQNANDYNGYTITGPNEVMCVCRNGGRDSIASNI